MSDFFTLLADTKEGVGVLSFLKIAGGLAFFIFGMKIMSEGIQKVAGNKLRDILKAMTSNRFTGVFTGFLTTSVIQSSSATTVMVVSFVNAGLLNLKQSIGVIMGANIGTTMTAWIIAILGFKFSLSDYALALLAFGVPMLFFSKVSTKNLGEFIIGFCLLFIGLDALKEAVSALDLQHNEAFVSWITSLSNPGKAASYGAILLFVLIGTLLTVIVQSSSAAIALTLVFVQEGLPFDLAAAIVLGENIGTTITANLAAIIGNVHAKRAAFAHFIFNVFGVVWMLAVFPFFIEWVGDIFYDMSHQEWASKFIEKPEDGVRYSLALFHTLFNIINTLLLVWFVNYIAKICVKFIKGKAEDEEFHLEYIGGNSMRTPELSILEARREVAKFGTITAKLPGMVRTILTERDAKIRKKEIERISKYEEITDRVEIEVATYLSKMSQGKLTDQTSIRVRSMLSIVNDLERIGDVFFQMSKTLIKKQNDKVYFTPEQRRGLLDMIDLLDQSFAIMNDNLNTEIEGVDLSLANEKESEINEKRNSLRDQHLSDMENKVYPFNSGLMYSDLFNSMERVGDHVINVSEACKGMI